MKTDWVDLADPDTFVERVPFDEFEFLRREHPVSWHEEPAPNRGFWAVTRHATSRAGDPSPHDHVLLANVVETLDEAGGWKAADTNVWRDHLHAATVVGDHT